MGLPHPGNTKHDMVLLASLV